MGVRTQRLALCITPTLTLPRQGGGNVSRDTVRLGTHRICDVSVGREILRTAVDREIRNLIRERGRITFADFMRTALYSRPGGFYASRAREISAHFGTAPMSHPAFGILIARQLDEMWRRLGTPPVFDLIEVGCGDGSLSGSIVEASRKNAPAFFQALHCIASDYEPRRRRSSGHASNRGGAAEDVPRVSAQGLRPFRNVVGCILANELIDNFPVHRFAIEGGRVREIFVTLDGENYREVLDEPSSPGIEARLAGLALAEGYRGEVNLAIEEWTCEIASSLERGFVLTIDYGHETRDLYAPGNNGGTMACFHRHAVHNDPYRNIGEQDITCHVDFTSLVRLGEQHGLARAGYARQREFLTNLGFSSLLDALADQRLSAARTELNRIALMSLVNPDDYGDFKVLAQAKGIELGKKLRGFTETGDQRPET